MRIPPPLVGIAGEYFVAAELSRRGYIASVSLRNARGIDILATNQDASHCVTIQCKTSQVRRRVWILNEKSERFVSKTHFYVFVAFGRVSERPSYHVVPSRDVAEYIRKSHREWLRKPAPDGRRHKDSPIRKFSDPDGKYLERWDLLAL